MNRIERAVQEVINTIRLVISICVLLAFLVLIVSVMAYSTQTHTFSDDHYTIANSTDGERVIVTYEVIFEKHSDMSSSEKKGAMGNMALVQSCANERLDTYIESRTSTEVRNTDLREVVVGCGNEYISIERLGTTSNQTFNTIKRQ